MVTGSLAQQKLFDCPALTAIKVVSGKWKTRILWLLRDRAYHFNELRRTLPGISGKILVEQIRQLENAGIIVGREVMRDGLQHVDYDFTAYGRTLVPVLDAFGHWGLEHQETRTQA